MFLQVLQQDCIKIEAVALSHIIIANIQHTTNVYN